MKEFLLQPSSLYYASVLFVLFCTQRKEVAERCIIDGYLDLLKAIQVLGGITFISLVVFIISSVFICDIWWYPLAMAVIWYVGVMVIALVCGIVNGISGFSIEELVAPASVVALPVLCVMMFIKLFGGM